METELPPSASLCQAKHFVSDSLWLFMNIPDRIAARLEAGRADMLTEEREPPGGFTEISRLVLYGDFHVPSVELSLYFRRQ